MTDLSLTLDAAWATGLLLAMTRVAVFVVAAPTLARFVPVPGRLAFVLVIGLFLATPVHGLVTLPALVGAAVVNAVIGATLGFLTGLLFHLFASAGGLIDITSNLSAATVLDPTRGEQGAVFSRLFNLAGIALFLVSGGIGVLVAGLAASVRAVPLDGLPVLSGGLARLAVEGTSRLMVVAVEVALPVLAVLFLVEVVLGVAARFAPQANVFLVGFPVKILVTLATVSASVMLLPEAVDGYTVFVEDTFRAILSGLGG